VDQVDIFYFLTYVINIKIGIYIVTEVVIDYITIVAICYILVGLMMHSIVLSIFLVL
jgi:hypothetical protein